MTFPSPVVAWRGQQDGEQPLVVLLHGRDSYCQTVVHRLDGWGVPMHDRRVVRVGSDQYSFLMTK